MHSDKYIDGAQDNQTQEQAIKVKKKACDNLRKQNIHISEKFGPDTTFILYFSCGGGAGEIVLWKTFRVILTHLYFLIDCTNC